MVLDTRADLENELKKRLQVADNSTLFPATRLTELIQGANLWATSFYPWDDLYTWLKTNSAARNYYSYPQSGISNSIMNLMLDGVMYSRRDYEDFEAYMASNPTSTKKIFATRGRLYFINPTPGVGVANLHIYVATQVQSPYDLQSSSNPTMFSYSMNEVNEAIVKKALSVALKRDDPNLAKGEEADAIAILGRYVSLQKVYKSRDQRVQHVKFDVPNFFAGASNATPIGRFNYDPSEVDL